MRGFAAYISRISNAEYNSTVRPWQIVHYFRQRVLFLYIGIYKIAWRIYVYH